MSIARALGIRSMVASLVEAAVFFLIVTPLCFNVIGAVYTMIAWKWSSFQAAMMFFPYSQASWGAWSGVLPVWMWAVQGAAYLALVVVYWAPADEEANRAELRGLLLFVILGVAALLGWLQYSGGYIGSVAGTFWSIVTGTAKGA